MKSQILFTGENKKNITNLSSAGLAKRVVMVKQTFSNKITFLKPEKITKLYNKMQNTCRIAHMKTEAWTICGNYIILNSFIS